KALGELRVDELVDHDPRRHDAARERVAKEGRQDDEPGEPGPDWDAPERRPRPDGRRLRPPVASKPELPQALAELDRDRALRLEPDLGARAGPRVDARVRDDVAAGRLLDRCHVLLGDPADVELPGRVRPRGVAH